MGVVTSERTPCPLTHTCDQFSTATTIILVLKIDRRVLRRSSLFCRYNLSGKRRHVEMIIKNCFSCFEMQVGWIMNCHHCSTAEVRHRYPAMETLGAPTRLESHDYRLGIVCPACLRQQKSVASIVNVSCCFRPLLFPFCSCLYVIFPITR